MSDNGEDMRTRETASSGDKCSSNRMIDYQFTLSLYLISYYSGRERDCFNLSEQLSSVLEFLVAEDKDIQQRVRYNEILSSDFVWFSCNFHERKQSESMP